MSYIEIRYPFAATIPELERAENDVCRLLWGDDSPLQRYLHIDVNFETFPYPKGDLTTGRITIAGEIPEELFRIYTCSQKFSRPKGIPTLTLRSYCLKETTEEAFLSYLTSFSRMKGKRGPGSAILSRNSSKEPQLTFALKREK